MQLPIKRSLEAIPGGMMLVPLVIGAVLHTVAPGMPAEFGSFTGALFTGALPILAVFYVCMGTTIELGTLSTVLSRGGSLLLTKIALGFLAALLLGHLLGERPVAHGWFAGLSPLAVVAASPPFPGRRCSAPSCRSRSASSSAASTARCAASSAKPPPA